MRAANGFRLLDPDNLEVDLRRLAYLGNPQRGLSRLQISMTPATLSRYLMLFAIATFKNGLSGEECEPLSEFSNF